MLSFFEYLFLFIYSSILFYFLQHIWITFYSAIASSSFVQPKQKRSSEVQRITRMNDIFFFFSIFFLLCWYSKLFLLRIIE